MADPALGIARRRPLAVGDPLECDPLEGDPLEGDPFGEPLEGVRGREGGEAAESAVDGDGGVRARAGGEAAASAGVAGIAFDGGEADGGSRGGGRDGDRAGGV